MALAVSKDRNKVVTTGTVPSEYRQTLATYLEGIPEVLLQRSRPKMGQREMFCH